MPRLCASFGSSRADDSLRMTAPSPDERLLSTAELALVRHGLQRPGLSVADESTLRYAFALARLSLQATPHVARTLAEFRRAALGAAHALFGDSPDSPRTPEDELVRAAASRLICGLSVVPAPSWGIPNR